MKVVIAEKPAVARDIASHLGATTRKPGYMEGNGWAVTWAFGHLVELKEPHEYNPDWKGWALASLPMVPPKFALRPRGDKGAQEQLKIIKGLLKEAEEIVCATDAGREGELIFRYIQEWTRCTKTPFKRLWISSLTDAAILDGFKKLRPGKDFDPLYHAARCRSEADWIVGLNGTRFYTVSSGEGRQLWSVGRVQTPVLALIVNRDIEIERFVPEDYWEVHTLYRETRFKHKTGKFKVQEDAAKLLEAIKESELEIVDIKEKAQNVLPPLLFDLTNLQKEMNKRFGLSADATLKAAQVLYESKHLTYPRTDSQCLSEDMKPGLPPLIEKLRKLYPKQVEGLDLTKLPMTKRVINDAKVSDHHAIIPTEQLPSSLAGNEAKVYNTVVLRFLAAFYPKGVKSITTVDAKVIEEKFSARGTVILEKGWMDLYPHLLKKKDGDENQVMPRFELGEKGPHLPEVKTCQTKPPKRYTEGTLLTIMESAGRTVKEDDLKEALKDKGLGTPATRAAIIETILSRGYIQRQKKNLISTGTGRRLIGLVSDERLKSAELTGEWEGRLKQMEKGEYDPAAFMAEVVTYTREIVAANPAAAKAGIGSCPKCEAELVEGKKGFGCSKWKEGCDFVLWKEAFGTQLSRALVAEMFVHGKTLVPTRLEIDGETCTGFLIWKDGELSVEKVEQKAVKGALGTCPLCGSGVVDTPKTYGCSRWREGCGFAIWKTIAKKKISLTMAKTLLEKGETEPLKGFTSKAGNPFEAALKLEDGGRVGFLFADR